MGLICSMSSSRNETIVRKKKENEKIQISIKEEKINTEEEKKEQEDNNEGNKSPEDNMLN